MPKRKKSAGWIAALARRQGDVAKASRVITGLAVLVGVLVTLAFWLLYLPGRHTHAPLLREHTTARLSLQPYLIQDYITSLAPGITRFVGTVPKFTSMQARAFKVDWIHALPYEITFLAEQEVNDSVGVTAYVNPIPDNDSFVGEVNAWGALGRIPVVRWQSGRLMPMGEQQFSAKGAIGFAPGTAAARRPGLEALSTYRAEHLIECTLLNDAGLYVLLQDAFAGSFFEWMSPETHQALSAAAAGITQITVTGDLTRSDEITFQLSARLGRGVDSAALEQALRMASDELSVFFHDVLGMSIVGDGAVRGGSDYTGTWVFTGFEEKIRRAWR